MNLGGRARKSLQRNRGDKRTMTALKHFKRNLPLRILCDARKKGLWAVLQQESEEGWETTCFASRFSTEVEKKYSIIDLELLTVVWAIEIFRNFFHGTEFEVVSDHKALMTILKHNPANKNILLQTNQVGSLSIAIPI